MENGFALIGARIFDGIRFHDHHAVNVRAGKIVAIVPQEQVGEKIEKIELAGGILSPGFIDAQVNGGGGIMFNEAPSVQTITHIVKAHRPYGTTSLLPTLISDTAQVTYVALNAANLAVREQAGVLGLHLEGPHLAPSRKGAHQTHFMRPLTGKDIEQYIAARAQIGPLLITLAAEQATPEQVAELTSHNIIVSLGHSNATYAQSMRLFDAGASGVTHLFNAMSGIGNREAGLVGAALDHPHIWAGIIADGHHVAAANLRIAKRAKQNLGGEGRLFFITDAMALTGTHKQDFILHGRRVSRSCGEICSKLTLEDGTLAGSDLDMASAVRFGINQLNLPHGEALAMASAYPARFLKLTDRGFILPGMRADLVHLDKEFYVQATWVEGQFQKANNKNLPAIF